MQARKSEAVPHGDGARGWEAQVNHPLGSGRHCSRRLLVGCRCSMSKLGSQARGMWIFAVKGTPFIQPPQAMRPEDTWVPGLAESRGHVHLRDWRLVGKCPLKWTRGGVPTVVLQEGQHLCRARTRVQSPARHPGLRIWC